MIALPHAGRATVLASGVTLVDHLFGAADALITAGGVIGAALAGQVYRDWMARRRARRHKDTLERKVEELEAENRELKKQRDEGSHGE